MTVLIPNTRPRRLSLLCHEHTAQSGWMKEAPASRPCYWCAERLSRRSHVRRRLLLSLVGSYEELLLAGRTLGAPSRPIPFTAQISVNVTEARYAKFRRQKKLNVPFMAVFYHYGTDGTVLPGAVAPHGLPYVGDVDLEGRYVRQFREHGLAPLERFPGYNVPRCGTIQLVVVNSEHTVCSVHLVPYELNLGSGFRTWVRVTKTGVGEREGVAERRLVSIVRLQFAHVERRFYLCGVKVVFHHRASEDLQCALDVMVGPATPLDTAYYAGCARCTRAAASPGADQCAVYLSGDDG